MKKNSMIILFLSLMITSCIIEPDINENYCAPGSSVCEGEFKDITTFFSVQWKENKIFGQIEDLAQNPQILPGWKKNYYIIFSNSDNQSIITLLANQEKVVVDDSVSSPIEIQKNILDEEYFELEISQVSEKKISANYVIVTYEKEGTGKIVIEYKAIFWGDIWGGDIFRHYIQTNYTVYMEK